MNKNNIDFAGSYVALGKCIGETKYIVFGKEYTEEEVKSIFEKATPKKPDFKEVWTPRTLDSLGEPLGCYAYCPNCGNDLYVEAEELPLDEETKVLNSYCPTCGQALDWSEEDE